MQPSGKPGPGLLRLEHAAVGQGQQQFSHKPSKPTGIFPLRIVTHGDNCLYRQKRRSQYGPEVGLSHKGYESLWPVFPDKAAQCLYAAEISFQPGLLFLPLLPVPEKYIVCAGLVLIAVVGLIPGIRKFTSLNREIRSIENDPPKILYEIHDGSYDLTAYDHGEKTGTSKTFLNEIYKKRELGQTKIFALYLNYDEQVNYIDARALPPEGLALLRRLLKMP